MMRTLSTLAIAAFAVTAGLVQSSCTGQKSTNTSPTPEKTVYNVILDTDVTSSTDDVVTLAAMYNLMKAGDINIMAIMVDRMGGGKCQIY